MNKLKKMALMVVGQNLNTDELQGGSLAGWLGGEGRRGLAWGGGRSTLCLFGVAECGREGVV